MATDNSNIIHLGKHRPSRDVNTQLGRNIRRMRLSRALEVPEFAEILGITAERLISIESAKTSVYASELYQFSEALSLPITDFHSFEITEADKDLSETLNDVFDIDALRDECVSIINHANDADTLLRLRDRLSIWLKS